MPAPIIPAIYYSHAASVISYCPEEGTFMREGKPMTCRDRYGYLVAGIIVNGHPKQIRLHRLAMFLLTGSLPDQVDHINGVRDDNREVNLRACTASQNMQNHGVSKNNTSGVSGVHWHKRTRKWYARIAFQGKRVFLGDFASLEDAAEARKQAEIKYFGKFRRQV